MNNLSQLPELQPDVAALRQKPPFRFVERVESLDREQWRIVAWLAEGDGQSFRPIGCMPAYVVLEALAQTSSLLLMAYLSTRRRGYIVGFESLRLAPPASSSGSVRLQVHFEEGGHPFYNLGISANCGSQILAEGRLRVYVEK